MTAIYPASTVALATGAVSTTTVPPAVATPTQGAVNPASPLATGVQGSAAVTPQPCVAVEVEQKVEVKREIQTDAPTEEGGQGTPGSTTNSSMATDATTGT